MRLDGESSVVNGAHEPRCSVEAEREPAPEGTGSIGTGSRGNRLQRNRLQREPAPEGPALEGPAPEGPALEGPAPEGPAPEGPALEGPAPEGWADGFQRGCWALVILPLTLQHKESPSCPEEQHKTHNTKRLTAAHHDCIVAMSRGDREAELFASEESGAASNSSSKRS
ncbi:hypothetical protein EYF80_065581 [Liparis tanakae]|uniref:Uncharacterized protein n=1 Tax=Liparis tanakae TaxID=230148 RepID=A0A4Z2E5U7_9TELE|nr:hypothetical protein EYF80_065581 [Liparis tanakae]